MFEKRWKVKKLYVAYPAILTSDLEFTQVYYNEANEMIHPIIVKKINNKYVKNILTNKTYAIFGRLNLLEYRDKLREYVVSELTPLESLCPNKTTISETEIRKMLARDERENSDEVKEPFLACILETIEKVKNSGLSSDEKCKLAENLNSLLDYYNLGLKKLNHHDNDIELTITPSTLLALREECLKRLTEIEENIPSGLTNNDNDFKILRKEIDSLIK